MKMRNALALLVLFAFPSSLALAEDHPYISVGQAKARKTVLAITPIHSADGGAIGKSIRETVMSDLTFMDLFRFLEPSAFVENASSAGVTPGTFKMSDWTSIGAEFLLKSVVKAEGETLALEAYLYETATSKAVFAKRLIGSKEDLKTLAHTLANNVVESLTGLPGIFLTKIAMSCDRSGKKEIYIMDFDGTNTKQITKHRSIAFAPAWSPDGSKIAYSLYTRRKNNVKNIDLYEYSFSDSTVKLLSNRKGINSGAAYSPDGKQVAMTMSFLGNPEIFLFNPTSEEVTRITNSFGFDVDPSWSPDGKKIAFVSNRAGVPMVFTMNVDGSNPQRLTFAGRYNATPSWSAQNNKIAFAGWLDGHFDIFIMNPDGSNIERLSKNQGNNEDPSFSPDGNFIVFSSNRSGQQNIYAMNVDGTFVKRLTFGMGNCVAPKWSNPPKH